LPLTRISRIEEDAQFFLSREGKGLTNSETRVEILKFLDAAVDTSMGSAAGLLKSSPGNSSKPRALYQLTPITGKRHQLRIHMCALGIPIESDQFYPEVVRCPKEIEDFSQALQLLAEKIAFNDPITGEEREFKSLLRLNC
jgi:tRNA pseudouridine32 synthase/23S rRNA pseudouridine746 synthase